MWRKVQRTGFWRIAIAIALLVRLIDVLWFMLLLLPIEAGALPYDLLNSDGAVLLTLWIVSLGGIAQIVLYPLIVIYLMRYTLKRGAIWVAVFIPPIPFVDLILGTLYWHDSGPIDGKRFGPPNRVL